MKKLVFIFSTVLFLAQWASAQTSGSVRAILFDANSGDEIPFASVSVQQNGQVKAGTVSDGNGAFELKKLAFAKYELVVSFIGYETTTIPFSLSAAQAQVNLGKLKIAPSAVALEAVKVKAMANTSATKIDRKTYRATDFETAKGGTAVDVLNKLPAVSVSPDGEVSVRGTTDFMVYLNGRPTQMDPSELLAQIAGNSIENIEVITVPTAKYDAQGKGGIINITTKGSGVQGLSISANGLLGGAPWAHKEDKYSGYNMTDNRYGGGLNLMYGKGKLNLHGGFNYNYRNVNGKRAGDARVLTDKATGTYKHMVADGERPEWYEYYSANAGFDYSLSEASQLSASYYYGNRTGGRSAFYIYNIFRADKNKTTIDGVDRSNKWVYNPNTDNRYGVFHTANVDYTYRFGKRSKLKASFLYEHSNLSRALDNYDYGYNPDTDQAQEVELHFNLTDETPLDGYRFSLDYATEFDNGHTLELGVQPQWLNVAGDFVFNPLEGEVQTEPGVVFDNGIDLTRGIYAGYVDYKGAWGKLTYMAGLRLEYTNQQIELDNTDYLDLFDRENSNTYTFKKLDWFPTLHTTYALGSTSKLSLAASRRISRPPVKNMAPFLYRRHLEVFVVGDPALKPEYVNNVELSFDQKIGKNSITLTGFYRGVENQIFRVNTVMPLEEVLIRSYTNAGDSKALGAELNANFVAGSVAKFFVGASVYNYHIEGEIFGYKEDNQSTNWSLKANASFALSPALKFVTDFNLKSATVTSQGQNDMFYMTNAALSYSPAKLKGWNFSLRVLDVLQSNIQGLDTKAHGSDGAEIFYQETTYTRNGLIGELGVTYTFNKKPTKKSDSAFGKKEF